MFGLFAYIFNVINKVIRKAKELCRLVSREK